MKRFVADTKVIGYLCMVSVQGFEPPRPETTDLAEGGVVTDKPTTPEDTREHHAQYNRQTTALHSHRPLASGCRRGMQLHCNVVWDYVKLWTSGPAGRLAALYASLCLRFWSEFRGIPPREPPICFRRKRKKEKGPPRKPSKARAPSCHSAPLTELHCRFPAVSPCPCSCAVWAPASQGPTSPSSAPPR